MGVVARGEVWWVDFGDPTGSAPGYWRPAVVVSSERFNRSRISTAVVAAVTSNTRLASAPGNVALPDGLLPKQSVVNVSQLMTLDRSAFVQRMATVPTIELRRIDDGLRLALDL